MKIKYKLEFNRIATLNTKKGTIHIGNVVEYKENTDGTLNIMLELNPLLPKEISSIIHKNPKVLSIQSKVKEAKNVYVLP